MDKACIVAGVLITAIATIGLYIFESRRYLTNNPNATADDFHVHPEPNCPICLEAMDTDGPSCALLNCGHFLHRTCLRNMDNVRSSFQTNKCPICRTPIRYP